MQDQILIGKLDRVTGLNPDKAGFPIQFVLLFRTLSYSVLPYLFIFSSVLISMNLILLRPFLPLYFLSSYILNLVLVRPSLPLHFLLHPCILNLVLLRPSLPLYFLLCPCILNLILLVLLKFLQFCQGSQTQLT